MRNSNKMKRIRILLFLLATTLVFISISCDHPLDKDLIGNCSDNIQNQSEENIDCGGPCMPCASCDDGIQNGGETGIDCGGACQSCVPACSVSPSSIECRLYTISSPSSGYPVSESVTYSTYSPINNKVSLNFGSSSFSGLSSMSFYFYDVNPFVYSKIGQTAIYTANSSSSTGKAGQVYARYSGTYGYDAINGIIKSGQKIYVNRADSTKLQITFCKLIGNLKDTLSLSCTVN